MNHSFFNSFLDILFPEECLGCGKRGTPLCNACGQKLPKAHKESFTDIFACFSYQDERVKKAVWNLKYKARSSIGTEFGRRMHEEIYQNRSFMHTLDDAKQIILIPVPLSRGRLQTRGYNQAEKIAYGIARASQVNLFIVKTGLVEKQKETIPQAKIVEREKRLQNISGAFALTDPNFFKGKTVIVIDDVTTTGATLREVMTLIRSAGAKKVQGITFAH